MVHSGTSTLAFAAPPPFLLLLPRCCRAVSHAFFLSSLPVQHFCSFLNACSQRHHGDGPTCGRTFAEPAPGRPWLPLTETPPFRPRCQYQNTNNCKIYPVCGVNEGKALQCRLFIWEQQEYMLSLALALT